MRSLLRLLPRGRNNGKLRALPILLQRAYEEIRLLTVLRPQQDVYQVLTAGLLLDNADFEDGAGLAHCNEIAHRQINEKPGICAGLSVFHSGLAMPSRTVARRAVPNQACALLGWKQTDLAAASGVSEMSIKNIERGVTDARSSTIGALQAAFLAAGVIFLEPGDMRPGGAGVRLA